jgi:hypothetical protein
VEATTGPLGQGIGNAVGYALSGKRAAARFNTADHTIIDHHVIALNGDGCLQEGVAKEAIAFAGHNGLDNLILIYDSNDVTLDAMADSPRARTRKGISPRRDWDVGHHRRPRPRRHRRSPRKGQVKRQRPPEGDHRQDHHRQGHPGSRRHRQGSRRGRCQVHRFRPRRPRTARRRAFLRFRGGAAFFAEKKAASSAVFAAGSRPTTPGPRQSRN